MGNTCVPRLCKTKKEANNTMINKIYDKIQKCNSKFTENDKYVCKLLNSLLLEVCHSFHS